MKVDTMRFVDKWIGIPLTFIFTVFLRTYELIFLRRRSEPDVRRTLFIELSEMGSAILVDPALRKLRKEGPAELFFAIFRDNAGSLEILNTMPQDRIFKMRADRMFHLIVDVIRFMKWCRENKITCVIDLELFSRFTALLSCLSLAGSRVGFSTHHDEGMYRGGIINFPARYNPHVHITVNFISLVNTALGKHPTPYTTTPVSPTEINLEQASIDQEKINQVRNKISALYPLYTRQRIVLINPNASDMLPQRRWPPQSFIEVTKSLVAAFDDIIVIATGAPGERSYVADVVKGIGSERCLNSAGVFEFLELIPLYSISTAMLTNDSGPAHFASVTPLKVFVIFGPETPALYGPLGNAEPIYLGLPCSPCVSAANHRKTTCIPRPCVTGILPDLVTEKMKKYLGKTLND